MRTVSNIELLHADLSHTVIGAFYHVHSELGADLPEIVYRRALAITLRDLGVSLDTEVPATLNFRGREIGRYRVDVVVDERIIIECKATDRIVSAHRAQALTYLRATNYQVGLILNFGKSATFQRVVLETARRAAPLERGSRGRTAADVADSRDEEFSAPNFG